MTPTDPGSLVAIVAEAARRAEPPRALLWVDLLLAAGGVAALAILGLHALARRRADSVRPFADSGAEGQRAPPSPSDVVESTSPAVDVRIDAVLAAMIWFLLAAIGASQLAAAMGLPPDSSASLTWVSFASQAAGAATCAVLLSSRCRGGFLVALARSPVSMPGADWRFAAILGAVAIGLCPVFAEYTLRCLAFWFPDHTFAPHPTIQAVGEGAPPLTLLGMWLSAVIAAPLAEELFFRGLVQNALRSAGWSPGGAVVGAAIAFGLVHLNQPHAVPALVALGVLFGAAYSRAGVLMAPFLMHAVFNLKTMLWVTLGAGTGG